MSDSDVRTIGETLEKIKLHEIPGATLVRVGDQNDGGYVVLKEISEQTDRVVSFGVGNTCGFEDEFCSQFGATAALYDPFITQCPPNSHNFKLIRKGSQQAIPKAFEGCQGNSLLKMDVEWSEWDWLKTAKQDDLTRFSQIIIELHLLTGKADLTGLSPYFTGVFGALFESVQLGLFARYSRGLDVLFENFYAFHIHANNSLPVTRAHYWTFPPLVELSLVRKDLAPEAVPVGRAYLPTPLDQPNKTDRPDILDFYPLHKVA